MDGPEVTHWETGTPPDEEAVLARMAAQGLHPHGWGNAPGDRYSWHEHEYHKVLYCVRGSITFHTTGPDVLLRPGDRLDLPPRIRHAATVGPEGVRCVEAPAAPLSG
jgi:quercetin dioxygenase-like cupin family protein